MPTPAPATGRLSFTDAGTGTPLVLVHGFPLDGRAWADVATRLAATRRVIVPDLPGFGPRAAERPPTAGFSMQSLAESLLALLDHLGLRRATFAGLSMGGYVIQSLVRIAPERVAAMSLVDTRANADDDAGRAARDAMAALARERGTAAVVEQMLPKMLAPATFAAMPEVVARLREVMLACPAATVAHACEAMRDRADFTPLLASLPCPLQVIVGEHDAIAPPAVARAMHEAARGSRLDVIDDAGHMAPLEQPDAVARALAAFA